jgi:hypothetical protein
MRRFSEVDHQVSAAPLCFLLYFPGATHSYGAIFIRLDEEEVAMLLQTVKRRMR